MRPLRFAMALAGAWLVSIPDAKAAFFQLSATATVRLLSIEDLSGNDVSSTTTVSARQQIRTRVSHPLSTFENITGNATSNLASAEQGDANNIFIIDAVDPLNIQLNDGSTQTMYLEGESFPFVSLVNAQFRADSYFEGTNTNPFDIVLTFSHSYAINLVTSPDDATDTSSGSIRVNFHSHDALVNFSYNRVFTAEGSLTNLDDPLHPGIFSIQVPAGGLIDAHYFLVLNGTASTVPEPGTLALLGVVGAAGAGTWLRRRRTNRVKASS